MASYSGVCCKLATPMVAVVSFGQHRDARDRAYAKFKPPRLIPANGQASQPSKVALGRDHGARCPDRRRLCVLRTAVSPLSPLKSLRALLTVVDGWIQPKRGTAWSIWVSINLAAPSIELYVTPLDPVAVAQGWQYR